MNNIQKRFILFLIGCIGSRSLLTVIAKNTSVRYLKYMGYLAIIPAIGFLYIYLTGSRQTGQEVFGEKIWWNHLRPFHSFMYFCFAYNAISGHRFAWKFLFVDVTVGLISFLVFHYQNGDFMRLKLFSQ